MSKVVIVGEAFGEHELAARHPFVGPSGRMLIRMLSEAGWFPLPPLYSEQHAIEFWLSHPDIQVTNVFNVRPRPTNDIINLCGGKPEGIPGRPPLQAGKYVRAEYGPELERLSAELRAAAPNLIIALGATAAWFLFGAGRIAKVRGAVGQSDFGKVLPTYHPAAVIRDWSLRPTTILDLVKAKREAEYPEIRRPQREVWIEPTLSDLWEFKREFIDNADYLSFDIESRGDTITCIGFAPSIDRCIVVPFVDDRKPAGSYWSTAEEELEAWSFVRQVLASEGLLKVAQNALFDMHFLWRRYGIVINNFSDDTMLLHHSLHPESPKGLDFLGSVYTNEASWKLMTRFSKTKVEGLKKDN